MIPLLLRAFATRIVEHSLREQMFQKYGDTNQCIRPLLYSGYTKKRINVHLVSQFGSFQDYPSNIRRLGQLHSMLPMPSILNIEEIVRRGQVFLKLAVDGSFHVTPSVTSRYERLIINTFDSNPFLVPCN